jgi:hypothetical protein
LIVGLIAILIALNAASYVQTQKEGDSELRPNRSTFNPGATGTQAFFTLLSETGRKAIRWQDSPDALLTAKNKPSVFVMIGTFRREITENETATLLRWTSQGGRLVIIDREPPKDLCTTTANWKISVSSDPAIDLFSVDPSDQKQMTISSEAAKPTQPTVFTGDVNAVQPSRFAGWVSFERFAEAIKTTSAKPPPLRRRLTDNDNNHGQTSPPAKLEAPVDEINISPFNAPVVHLAGNQKNLLVDVPFGSGSIVYLADPYIVSNGGINIVDNAQLALNIVSTSSGPIAFDEYHQGYGSNANRLFEYFAGTPVIAIFLQCALLIGLVFLSQSRRFARPLPEKKPDRLSKLEYVTAMAELQQRTRAYDLAMENIYTDFRRRVARALGVDNLTSTRREIALSIAERTSFDTAGIEALMMQCENIIHGEPTNKAETVSLTARLREIEEKLGINRAVKRKVGR